MPTTIDIHHSSMKKEITRELSVKEAAQIAAVHPEVIRLNIRFDKLKARRFGHYWCIHPADLQRWLRYHRNEKTRERQYEFTF